MRTVTITFDRQVSATLLRKTLTEMIVSNTGTEPTITQGRGLMVNGLPEGNWYVELQ